MFLFIITLDWSLLIAWRSYTEGLLNQTMLFGKVDCLGSGCRARAAFPPGITNLGPPCLIEAWTNIAPGSHVQRFLLTPHPFLVCPGITGHDFSQHIPVKGIELFNANNRSVAQVVPVTKLQQVVIDLAGTEHQARDTLGTFNEMVIIENFVKMTGPGKIFLIGNTFGMAQQALRRHQNQRFTQWPDDLAPQCMKILGGLSEVANLHVTAGTHLQEAFQARATTLAPRFG